MTATKKEPTTGHESFGPYEVYERLGVGGMATVHRAKERGIEGFERIVALKRLLPHLAEDASFVRSFVREAKLASMLQHPNIVQLYELGRVGSAYFISMEYIEGRDIRKILRQSRKAAGPPPLSVFIGLMTQLCDALDYAHARADQHGEPLGLVHRDVSPSNLLITHSGHLKVIDFGIAKAQSQQLRTQTGRVKGKLAYMAPEAVKGQELDARSDIFAAGVIAHELLTARPLFASKNEYQTLLRVQRTEVEPPSRYNPDCSPELDDIVLMALARDPADRWQSGAEFRDALLYLRSQCHLSATSADVAEWMKWAFALGNSSHPRPGSQSESIAIASSISPSYPSAPHRAFARLQSPSEPLPATTGELSDAEDSVSISRTQPLTRSPEESAEVSPEESIDESPEESPEDEPIPARPRSPSEADEEAADFAWGGHEHDRGVPVLLDDVPDVSYKAIPARPDIEPDEGADTGSKPHGTSFGAGIVAERDRRKRHVLISAALSFIAVAGISAYVIKTMSKPEGSADPVSRTATLKFVIEPGDATIDILGYGAHEGSPHELSVEAPGTYQVTIAREGYKSYVTELAVEGGEKNVVRVALIQAIAGSNKAQVAVRSTPKGQRLLVDGVEVDQRTPATVEVAPGNHRLVIQDDDGDTLWQHEFEATANTQYEFLPSLQDENRRRRRDERRRSRDRPNEKDEGDEVRRSAVAARASRADRSPPAPSGSPSGSASSSRSGASDVAAPSLPDRTGGIDSSRGPSQSDASFRRGGASAIDSLGKSAPLELPVPGKAPPRQPATSLKPVTVPPFAVKKRSGSLPIISGKESEIPSRGSAKLCIDTTGRVTAVSMLVTLPPRARQRLEEAFKDWRYTPYVQDGQAVPACFALNFTIDLSR